MAHCDIKPGNILLTYGFVPVIADFGLVGVKRQMQGRGTKSYAAPEVFNFTGILTVLDYQKADIYSLGLLLLRMLTQFKDHSPESIQTSLQEVDAEHSIMIGKMLG